MHQFLAELFHTARIRHSCRAPQPAAQLATLHGWLHTLHGWLRAFASIQLTTQPELRNYRAIGAQPGCAADCAKPAGQVVPLPALTLRWVAVSLGHLVHSFTQADTQGRRSRRERQLHGLQSGAAWLQLSVQQTTRDSQLRRFRAKNRVENYGIRVARTKGIRTHHSAHSTPRQNTGVVHGGR